MKAIFSFLFASILLSGFTQATAQNNPLQVISYIAENESYYAISGCNPNSAIAFYSTPGGGKLLKTITVNNEGYVLVQAGKDFKPAFILNRANKATGIRGNGKVFHFNEKDFTIENIKGENRHGITTINWDASVKNHDDYYFEVLKSKDEINFTTVQEINPQASGENLPYVFSELFPDEKIFYKIRVAGIKNNFSYVSKAIILNGNPNLNIYPTVFKNLINIDIDNDALGSKYIVQNIQGQTILSGTLNSEYSEVNTESLASGMYLLKVNGTTQKIIKQ